ncbi:MAG TPA: addiction module antidote protein [Luteibaculaceae bacterium]|nr:addiction module antidote protein [Luteibaculaceae bacterium]
MERLQSCLWKGINPLSKKTLKRPVKFGINLKSKNMETSKFDIADYLDNSEMIAEYLNVVLAEGSDAEIIASIGHTAKAIGMAKIAEESGLSRPSLYKALSDGAKPQFSTIMKVLKAVGGQIRVNPVNV